MLVRRVTRPTRQWAAWAAVALATTSLITGCASGGADRSGASPASAGTLPGPSPTPSATTSSGDPTRTAGPGHGGGHATGQGEVLARLPGPKTGGCVTVGARRVLRSGDLAMGDFVAARAAYAHTATPRMPRAPIAMQVIPADRAVRAVRVTATPLAGGASPTQVRSSRHEPAGPWLYFPVEITLKAPGTWRFEVIAGAAHGCFEATFRP